MWQAAWQLKILPAKYAKETLKLKGESFLFSRLFAYLAGNVPVSLLALYSFCHNIKMVWLMLNNG